MNGIFISDKNTITSPDTNNTTFTRIYQFYFWIPFYMEGANNIEDIQGYVVDLETRRYYGYSQVNNGITKLSVPFSVGNGSVFKRFRSSIVY